MAFLVTALMALLTILVLAGLFKDLPKAILGAIVIWAVSGMIIASLGRSSDGARFSDLEDDPGATPILGVLIHRFEAELIFANADLFQDDVLARVRAADPNPRR